MYIKPDGTFVMPRKISGARKVAKGRRNHYTGQMVLGTADDPCHLDFESHTEYMTCLCLIARMDVVAIENRVPFEWTKPDGRKATHDFDFRVSHDDGTRVAIMVKGSHRTESARMMGEIETIAAEVPASSAEDVVLMAALWAGGDRGNERDSIDLRAAKVRHCAGLSGLGCQPGHRVSNPGPAQYAARSAQAPWSDRSDAGPGTGHAHSRGVDRQPFPWRRIPQGLGAVAPCRGARLEGARAAADARA